MPRMLTGAQLIAEGRKAAPPPAPPTAFLRAHGATSEAEYKRRCRDEGRVMYHMHVGLSTWEATEAALVEVHAALAEAGHSVDRFGLALDRAMGVPESERHLAGKETGPRIAPDEWRRLGEAAPIQPHLGDYMMGFPAGFQNTLRALSAGVTTIGNVGQYTAYDLLGGSDEVLVTEETVRALAAIGALRGHGALAHSNLEDGSATQASHFGAYVGWAALELYVVEGLVGARLAHCFGNTIQQPECRAVVHFALDDLRGRDSIGSMIYGNTVDHRPGDRAHNSAAVTAQLMCDIALQLRRPTGHAVNPVPLTEAERIPSAAEIVEIQLLARDIEREVRASADLHDWAHLERLGTAVAEYAMQFRDLALAALVDDGIDVADAAQVLLALRRTSMAELERRVDLTPSAEIAGLEPWKASHVRDFAARLNAVAPRLDGVRVVLAVLEVHDLVRDALARVLPTAGAEVVLLGANAPIESIVRAAIEEDADAIVVGVYNGNALVLGQQLAGGARRERWGGTIYMGGILTRTPGRACRSMRARHSRPWVCAASTRSSNSSDCSCGSEARCACRVRELLRSKVVRLGTILITGDIGDDPSFLKDLAQSLEGAGFDAVLTNDHVVGAHPDRQRPGEKVHTYDVPCHEPLVLLTFLGAVTTRLELATSIVISTQRQTVLLAKQAAELDLLTGGRLRLGVGIGRNWMEYEALEQDFTNRGRRIEEQVAVMRQLWTNDLVTFDGKWHHLDRIGINPLPVQRPIPIWMGSFFGSLVEKVLERTGRLADGWMPQFPPGEQLAGALERLRGYATAAGRDPDSLGIECGMRIGVDDDPQAWVDTAAAFRALGATHLRVSTAGGGYTTPAEHLAASIRWHDTVAPVARG